MALESLWQTLEASSLATFLAESAWAFPTVESLHVLAIVTVVGSIAIMDLRLLGLASNGSAVSAVSDETLPYVWIAFMVAVATGSLLFVSRATAYAVNTYFIAKMVCLVLAGLNMLLFQSITWRGRDGWDHSATLPLAARMAGGISLLFWIMVVVCGRLIGFTLAAF